MKQINLFCPCGLKLLLRLWVNLLNVKKLDANRHHKVPNTKYPYTDQHAPDIRYREGLFCMSTSLCIPNIIMIYFQTLNYRFSKIKLIKINKRWFFHLGVPLVIQAIHMRPLSNASCDCWPTDYVWIAKLLLKVLNGQKAKKRSWKRLCLLQKVVFYHKPKIITN